MHKDKTFVHSMHTAEMCAVHCGMESAGGSLLILVFGV